MRWILVLCLALTAASPRVSATLGGSDVPEPAPLRPRAISFVDRSTGFVLVRSLDPNIAVQLLRTDNGGDSWATVGDLDMNVQAIAFVSRHLGWATGLRCLVPLAAELCFSILWRTTDGGQSWARSLEHTITRRLDGEDGVLLPQFADPAHGWTLVGTDHCVRETVSGSSLGCDRRLLATDDGGVNWTGRYQGDLRLDRVRFVDAFRGWATASGVAGGAPRVVYTGDGGRTWDVRLAGGTAYDLAAMDAALAYVLEYRPMSCLPRCRASIDLLRTTDAGAHWTVMQDAREHDDGIWWPLDTRPNLGERITGLTAGSTKTVAVTSNRGQWAYDVDTVIVSHDGGMTWSRAPRSGPEHPTAVWLADDRTGFALGGPPKTESHYVWRTRDGGASWNIVLPR